MIQKNTIHRYFTTKGRVVRASDQILMPWKNGGGVTREIAKKLNKEGEIVWRASRATVS